MKIYNEELTVELREYAETGGRLSPRQRLVRHIEEQAAEAEQGHEETVAFCAETGGKEIRWVVDKPAKAAVAAHDEYEDVLAYVPYTAEETAERATEKRKAEIRVRLRALSEDLIQAAAGETVPNLDGRKAEFIRLHNELRVLEGKAPRETNGGIL